MKPLDHAIEDLQAEVDAYGQGTKSQPRDGSRDWLLLRAKMVGLATLKKIAQDDLEDHRDVQAAYRRASRAVKADEPPL